MLVHTDLEDRRMWSINERYSEFGKLFVISKILTACSNAFWYTVKSLKLFIITCPSDHFPIWLAASCLLLLELIA